MNRLLQGDVGSGKRWWRLPPSGLHPGGVSAALLAPTEILATQHAEA